MSNSRTLPIAAVIFFATLLATPFYLHAAEAKQIARSSKLGIELFGIGGDDWCSNTSQLQLSRTNNSPLLGKEETLFPKISKVFDAECPQMEAATIFVIDESGDKTREFQIAKATGWNLTNSTNKAVDTETTAQGSSQPAAEKDVSNAIEAPAAPPQKEVVKPEEQKPETGMLAAAEHDVSEEPVPLTVERMFLLAANFAPEALQDDRALDQLAILEGCDSYATIRKNEFALRDWRQGVRPEVTRKVNLAKDLFEFSSEFRVDRKYDFDTSMLDIGSFTPSTQKYRANCHWSYNFDDNFFGGQIHLTFEDLPDSFNRNIYLPDQLGRAAVDRLVSTRNKVRATYLVRVKDVGVATGWNKHYELKAEFKDVKIHTGKQFDYLLVHHEEAKFAAARKQHEVALQKAEEKQRQAEEQRLAEQLEHEKELRRLQLERENTQAQRLFDSLAGDNTVPAKLAALNHDGNTSFHNPYDLAARAFAQGGKLPVRAFVQVGDRDSVGHKATWPERVYLTGAELEEDEWYFVSGMVDGQKIDNTLQSIIAVDRATKCDDRICMDEQDVMDYVRSVYPQWSGTEE